MKKSIQSLVVLSLLTVPALAGATDPHGIYVAFPVLTGPTYTAELDNLITGPGAPYITGAACYPSWTDLQTANGAQLTTSTIDGTNGCLTEWSAYGKHVGLILGTSSYGSSNIGTPAWYTTPATISLVKQTAGVIYVTASTNTPFNFFVGSAVGQQIQIVNTGTTLDGVWTITGNPDSLHLTADGTVSTNNGKSSTSGTAGNPMIIDPTGACGGGEPGAYLPVYWSPNFINAWEAFLNLITARYNSNTDVDFYQPGFGRGFEDYIAPSAGGTACDAILTPLGYSTTTFLSYLSSMATFIASAAAGKPVIFSINYLDYPGCSNPGSPNCDTGDPLTEASYAAGAGLGIGSQGLQASDLTALQSGLPCDNNSCAAFADYPHTPIREWQTASLSDPTNGSGNITGDLAPLLPFAVNNGATLIEPYTNDALCAFDTSWVGSGTNTYAHCSAAGYANAFELAAQALANK
jgi:hypothetical protein